MNILQNNDWNFFISVKLTILCKAKHVSIFDDHSTNWT